MPYYYQGHCKQCCQICQNGNASSKKASHYYGYDKPKEFKVYQRSGYESYINDNCLMKIKNEARTHNVRTGHKSFALEEHEDKERPFMIVDRYSYTDLNID